MSNYSTTLPPGFKTWNELWNAHKDQVKDGVIVVKVPSVFFREYHVDFIKARAFDEIMELAKKNKDHRLSVEFETMHEDFVNDFQELTHTKLFK